MKLITVQYENIFATDSIVTNEFPCDSHWTLEEIKTENKIVFTGDGCLEGEYTIEIDRTVQPVKLPKRSVPVATMTPLKEELVDLVKRENIAPVESSTDWINSIVSVTKPKGRLQDLHRPKATKQST